MGDKVTTVYGLKSCDSCRKAVRALEDAGWEVRFVDIRAAPVKSETLARWVEQFGDALVNRRSTTWRGLGEADREGDPVALLQAHPAAMKRPVVVAGGAMFLGWGAEAQAALLGAD